MAGPWLHDLDSHTKMLAEVVAAFDSAFYHAVAEGEGEEPAEDRCQKWQQPPRAVDDSKT